MRCVPLLLLVLIWSTATSARADVVSLYQARTEKISEDALTAELEKHPEHWTKISMKLRFRIDPAGRIHDIQITSAVRNQWAEDTARHALSELKLPPVPNQVMREAGMDGCYASAQLILAKTESDFNRLMKERPK